MNYMYKRRYYKKSPKKVKIPKKSDFLNLGIQALKNRIIKLSEKIKQYDIDKNDFDLKYENWKARIKPYEEKVTILQVKLANNPVPTIRKEKIGGIFGLGGDYVRIPYTANELEIVEMREKTEEQILKLKEVIESFEYLRPIPNQNQSYEKMGEIKNDRISLSFMDEILKEKQKKEEKITHLKSMAADTVNEQRDIASNVKIKKTSNCLYCGKKLINPHKDHIYPVSKGGTSTHQNLVYVCAECNMKKSNLTLNNFIRKYGESLLLREKIEENLEKLNKDF